jgi:catechol 2,3-dioxygenase-like lactoylglutathione lyase family enzyme
MIFVSDVEASVRFYRDVVGMEGVRTATEYPEYAELPTEGATVSLMRPPDEWIEGMQSIGRLTGIVLTVPKLEELYQRLSGRGVQFSRPPEREFWGGLMTSFYDPDGNEISLLDEASAQRSAG